MNKKLRDQMASKWNSPGRKCPSCGCPLHKENTHWYDECRCDEARRKWARVWILGQ